MSLPSRKALSIEVLVGGGDWALFRSDGVIAIDARVALRTDDDALIHMTYGSRIVIPDDVRPRLADPAVRHIVDPGDYYSPGRIPFLKPDRRSTRGSTASSPSAKAR